MVTFCIMPPYAHFYVLVLAFMTTADGQCLDSVGKHVTWWFTYKLPGGYTYAYLDSNEKRNKGELQLFPYPLNDEKHPAALIRTLRGLVASVNNENKSSDGSYFMYNDQPDNAKPGAQYGHTKGVVGVGKSPFWLLHSTPRFPSSDGEPKFYFPENEIKYGQTFLCMSLELSDVDTIAGQFLYTRPYVYVNKVPSPTASRYPNLLKVFNKEWILDAASHSASFVVGGVQSFTSYAKNAKWGEDLYETLIAPSLNADLLVESWIRGQALGNYCKPEFKYSVTDVINLEVRDRDGTAYQWKETQDHAKWCLPQDNSNRVCVCDMNRMTSQRKRGGGCVCFKNEQLSIQLNNTIAGAKNCFEERKLREN
eukprot:m.11579 g.11579  ORF g.11579 m.11579 type:complete len:366 (+) comp4480_c0_seq1:117-1214(+)